MMDLQSEQAVWRRVKGPGPGAEEALLPERLEALILEERTDRESDRVRFIRSDPGLNVRNQFLRFLLERLW